MNPLVILVAIGAYFAGLFAISVYTSRDADNAAFFTGNRASPWMAVAFGMIADSLSGVTFISVPGAVAVTRFSYLQVVLGYLAGYFVIAYVLMPVYYRMNLTSIYTYLVSRFGKRAERTGSFFFIVSRTLGAAARLFLAAGVLQMFVFDAFHIPFSVSVACIIGLMLAYTAKGGIKTLVWTDSFQALFLVAAVVFSIAAVASSLHLGVSGLVSTVTDSPLSTTFFWDFKEKSFFWKQFLGGFFIAIAMTGLDQSLMQKNLTCRSLRDAQKNMVSFSVVMVLVNVLFLSLGILLYSYVDLNKISVPVTESGKLISDRVFPELALNHFGMWVGLAFVIGLTAATFSSADSVLTTLTTSFYFDFLHLQDNDAISEQQKVIYRRLIHIGFSALMLICVVALSHMNDTAIIDTILTLATYTYGPLLGIFAFGILTKRRAQDTWIPLLALVPPVACYYLASNSERWLNGYKVGLELLFFNGLLMFGLLWLFSTKGESAASMS